MKQHLQGSPTQKLRATVSSGLEISKKKTVLGFQDLDIILVRIVVGFWWSKTRQKKKKRAMSSQSETIYIFGQFVYL